MYSKDWLKYNFPKSVKCTHVQIVCMQIQENLVIAKQKDKQFWLVIKVICYNQLKCNFKIKGMKLNFAVRVILG